MIYATCTDIYREKKRIVGYQITDSIQNKPLTIKPEKLKNLIRSGKVIVSNLTLTKANRLIGKKENIINRPIYDEEEMEKYIAKMCLMNKAKDLVTTSGQKCILISQDDYHHILYIPKGVQRLNNQDSCSFSKQIQRLKGSMKVIGGKGLISTSYMFNDCDIRYLDFSLFHTENVENMSGMFYKCSAERLDLRTFNTLKVVNMADMFTYCLAVAIDLSSFKTPCLKQAQHMFSYCHAHILDVSTLDTSKITNFEYMFQGCFANKIIFGWFNTSNAVTMMGMFKECYADTLDLTSFNTAKVTTMVSMFEESKARSIDLRTFNTRKVQHLANMFKKAEVENLDLTSFYITANIYANQMFEDCNAKQIKVSKEGWMSAIVGRTSSEMIIVG